MTTIQSILSRLTKAVGGTEKMLYTEPELNKFAEFYLDKWDENTSEDVIAESFTDFWWDTDRACRSTIAVMNVCTVTSPMKNGLRNAKTTTRVIIRSGNILKFNDMANLATTIYKVTGTREAVNNLWTTFQDMEVDSKDIRLFKLAEHYGIDYEKKQISGRRRRE